MNDKTQPQAYDDSARSERDALGLRRDALCRLICARLCDERRSIDELRVIDWVLEGIEIGAEGYGALTIATDQRNFVHERAMEARDLLFYTAAQAIAQRDAEADRIERDLEETLDKEPTDPLGQRLDAMAKKLDEDRARTEALKREVAAQGKAQREVFDTSDCEAE